MKEEIEYTLCFKNSAAKEFRRLPKDIKQRVGIAIEQLRFHPRPDGVTKLKGDENLYRIRIGDYRAVYEIDDSEKALRITRVRHRRDVYQS
ncbi:MAG: type II toxin-antitoxin system RelE/ParE family toxin [Cyanobacteriota bacterium]|nr:type II toxin-antitoxin system RelE/ParE family toxin [Cyanobacteriota bacterium]